MRAAGTGPASAVAVEVEGAAAVAEATAMVSVADEEEEDEAATAPGENTGEASKIVATAVTETGVRAYFIELSIEAQSFPFLWIFNRFILT